jgi:rSAM/selenodomain-associated transferase 1
MNESESPPTVLVFLKAPRPGDVKTRLARQIGTAAATALYRQWAERQLRVIPAGWRVEIHFAPPDACYEMRAWLGADLNYHAQADGDLGARLRNAFAATLRAGARRVIAIGADCPSLDTACLQQAAAALASSDLVLGPARDGGYYLIGLRREAPELFADIPWSTAGVFATTLARADALALDVHILDEKEDIDDLAALTRAQHRGPGS